MNKLHSLGFDWDTASVKTDLAVHSAERVCFRFLRMLPEFVWDASVIEGNPITFPEVKTLLDGVTVGGRKVSDQEQVLNLADSAKELLARVRQQSFALDKATFCQLHAIVARNEALEWGLFRGEGREQTYTPDVALGEKGRYTPLATIAQAPELNRVFEQGTLAIQTLASPFERACAFFLFGAFQQFFFDGNKRTSRLMMNGLLMSAGIDSISVPAARAQEFNEKMVQFYLQRNGTEMFDFLASCHPDFKKILTF
jgi:Fic family protein